MNSSLVSIYVEEMSYNGGQVFVQSLLQLCNVGSSAAGTYVCTAGAGTAIAIELAVTGELPHHVSAVLKWMLAFVVCR